MTIATSSTDGIGGGLHTISFRVKKIMHNLCCSKRCLGKRFAKQMFLFDNIQEEITNQLSSLDRINFNNMDYKDDILGNTKEMDHLVATKIDPNPTPPNYKEVMNMTPMSYELKNYSGSKSRTPMNI